jgi:hypothetical protein
MEKYIRPLGMMQYQEHKPFVGRKIYFLKVETLLKMSSRADDHQQQGQVTNTAEVRELVGSDRRLIVKMIADEMNMNGETVSFILTEELGMREICAKMVPKKTPREKAGCGAELSF